MDSSETKDSNVIVYSTPVCHFCHAVKEFFDANEVEYQDYDVAVNAEKRQEMVDLTGQLGVPVIKINDDVVIGFDEAKIKELLSL